VVAKKSSLEETFALQVRAQRLPSPEREYRFAYGRQWRFDFSWPDYKVAVEIEGGTWARGKTRHTTGQGFLDDCKKYNSAAILGWLVLRGDYKMVHDWSLLAHLERALLTRNPQPEEESMNSLVAMIEAMQEELERARIDAVKFERDGNKAASTRVRKHAMSVARQCAAVRQQVLEMRKRN